MGELAKLIGYAVLALFAIGAYVEWQEGGAAGAAQSKADCAILGVTTSADTYFVQDEPDFGYTVRTIIHNRGQAGVVRVKATISTSEGNFERAQSIDFDANQQSTLAYQFSEPTLNATNIQSVIHCWPTTRPSS